jgi:hypothetical protein
MPDTVKRRILRKLQLNEISAVDNPCQQGALMTIMKREDDMEDTEYWKRDFTDKQRKAAADKGQAMPDGSFPIANEGDLHNAIRAVGRAKSYKSAKAHIIRRAKSMGASDQLPEQWKVSKAAADPLLVLKSKIAILKANIAKLSQDSDGMTSEGTEAAGEKKKKKKTSTVKDNEGKVSFS